MTTKTKMNLSITQLEYLISLSLKNCVQAIGENTPKGIKFLVVLETLDPNSCIPIDEEPGDEEEELEILDACGVIDLSEFINFIMVVEKDGQAFRAVEIKPINPKNVGKFLSILDDMDAFWEKMMEETPISLEGKNVVEGNGTVQ